MTRDTTDTTTGIPHIDDAQIESALLAELGELGHPGDPDAADVRDALDWMQQSMGEVWADWCGNIEHNDCEVVYEDRDVIVFATGEQNIPRRDVREHYPGEVQERLPDVISRIHHGIARDRCDYDWGYEYPLVVAKSGLDFDAGQRYVEAVVNSLQRRGLSPGQAWAYYGVEIRGESRNSWGKRKGDHDHRNTADALEAAKRKLPAAER